jgi:hypothetical protein
MLKKTASIVLASFRGSMYRSVRLASSLAAASLDGLFEHSVGLLTRYLFPRYQTSQRSISGRRSIVFVILLGISDNVRIGFFYPSNLVDLCDHHIRKGSFIGDIDEENNVRPSEAGVRLFDARKPLDGL